MASSRTRQARGPLALRVESGEVLAPSEVGARIENFVRTPEDTLRAIVGYCPYVPDPTKADTAPESNDVHAHIDTTIEDIEYGPLFGIFHTILANGREILLLQAGNQIWEHAGWSPARWVPVVGPEAIDPLFIFTLDDDRTPCWPTQFVGTPGGVVILPYEGRPLFYDGWIAAPLGYDKAPGAPHGRGPRNASVRDDATQSDVNQYGYAHDGNPKYPWYKDTADDPQTQMFPDFGYGRLGTVKADNVAPDLGHGGIIDASWYEFAYQWIDIWGNLSPVSPRSSAVSWPAQSARYTEPGPGGNFEHRPDQLLKQVLWGGIEPGPDATVGRVGLRTKDMLHAGTNKLFEVPTYASGGGSGAFATIPDNECTLFPDNAPDSWLLKEAVPVRPMPRARLACLAFGRMWFLNTPEDPSALYWSEAGKWGTVLENNIMYPDASGEGTGIHAIPQGLLVFTKTSTFLITMSEDAQFFKPTPLSTRIGCAAPSSIKTMTDGTVVWLSYDGFMAYKDGSVGFIGDPVAFNLTLTDTWALAAVAEVDRGSGEYRCWVPQDGLARNEMCWIYDGEGWRRRTDMYDARAVCVTNDTRGYMLIAGKAREGVVAGDKKWGVWLLDHATIGFDCAVGCADVPPTIESAWIEAVKSEERTTLARTWWMMRESSSTSATVLTYRDWRMVAPIDNAAGTGATLPLIPDDDPYVSLWGTVEYDAATTYWTRRRPFWATTDLYGPGLTVGKVVMSVELAAHVEFVAVKFESEFKRDGGARATKSPAGVGL